MTDPFKASIVGSKLQRILWAVSSHFLKELRFPAKGNHIKKPSTNKIFSYHCLSTIIVYSYNRLRKHLTHEDMLPILHIEALHMTIHGNGIHLINLFF